MQRCPGFIGLGLSVCGAAFRCGELLAELFELLPELPGRRFVILVLGLVG